MGRNPSQYPTRKFLVFSDESGPSASEKISRGCRPAPPKFALSMARLSDTSIETHIRILPRSVAVTRADPIGVGDRANYDRERDFEPGTESPIPQSAV